MVGESQALGLGFRTTGGRPLKLPSSRNCNTKVSPFLGLEITRHQFLGNLGPLPHALT
jgi:hypothetical protein